MKLKKDEKNPNDHNEPEKMYNDKFGPLEFVVVSTIIITLMVFLSGCSLLRNTPPEFTQPESRLSHLENKQIPEITVYSDYSFPLATSLIANNEGYAAFDQKRFHQLLIARAELEANTETLIALREIYTLDLEERNVLLQVAKDIEKQSFLYKEKAHNTDYYLNKQEKIHGIKTWLERGIFSLIIIGILL